jgi:translation elongation factor EF-Ts
MNTFLYRVYTIIRSQTGAGMYECKKAFEKTRSIKGAIDYLKCVNRETKILFDGQVL